MVEIKEGKIDAFLSVLFTDIKKSPVAFQSARRVYDFLRQNLSVTNIRLKDVQNFEKAHVRPNQIIRDRRKLRPKALTYIAYGPNYQWQCDLVHIYTNAEQKGPSKFLFTKIDVFTRKADIELIRNKSAKSVLKAFMKICQREGTHPQRLQTDLGKEFFNSLFRNYCRRENIQHYHVNSEVKASVVERFNRTIQRLIFKYKMQYPKMKWIG